MSRIFAAAFAALVCLTGLAVPAHAQVTAPRVTRTYVPPDQLVAFQAEVPFDQFLATLEPIFRRVTGKSIIDPEARTTPIGVRVQGMHFFDALVYVLAYNKISYRENERYFVVVDDTPTSIARAGIDQAAATAAAAAAPAPAPSGYVETPGAPREGEDAAVSLTTREVKINAVIFELNVTKTRNLGVDWSTFFSTASGGSGGSGGSTGGGTTGGTGTTSSGSLGSQTTVNTSSFFDLFAGRIAGPTRLSFAQLAQLFNFLEERGAGRTVASPNSVVRSGKEGRIQVGADIPIQTRDFAGNTQTQLISTGIIMKVVPTVVSAAIDTTDGSPVIDFVHLDVQVEKSTPGIFNGGVSITRSSANTNVLLLDGEQTVIGGLYSVTSDKTRRGIAFLKDLPLLGRLFGSEQTVDTQRELIVVMQAEVLNTVTERFNTPTRTRDLLEERREELRRLLQNTTPSLRREAPPSER